MTRRELRLESLAFAPLEVPLSEPFVIASGRMDATRAARVTATLVDAHARTRAVGLGEAAALPPVTREDLPEILLALEAARGRLEGCVFTDLEDLAARLDALFGGQPVTRAGVECAILDAWARLEGCPVHRLLGGPTTEGPRTLVTDITIPIHAPARMGELARMYRARGFSVFKVKVGLDLDDDLAALAAIHAAHPEASLRLDANGGLDPDAALRLLARAEDQGLRVECFEQPCPGDDLEAMAFVTARARAPVVVDESVKTLADLERVLRLGAARGVNLKLVKSGGLLAAFQVGARARAANLSIMTGAMVETRLGITAMAHVALALGGAEFVDLDTAFLLAADPFRGGYSNDGPQLTFEDQPGLGLEYAP